MKKWILLIGLLLSISPVLCLNKANSTNYKIIGGFVSSDQVNSTNYKLQGHIGGITGESNSSSYILGAGFTREVLSPVKYIKKVKEPVSSTTMLSRIYGSFRKKAESISISSLTTRIFGALRAKDQPLQISEVLGRLTNVSRTISQPFTTSIQVEKWVSKTFSQSLQITEIASRFKSVSKTISQPLNIQSILGRKWYAFRDQIQSISITTLLDRTWYLHKSISQPINLVESIRRIGKYFITNTQSIVLNTIVGRMYRSVNFLSQSVSIATKIIQESGFKRSSIQKIWMTITRYGLEFDGVDDYVIVNDSNSLDVDNITIDLWVKSGNNTEEVGVVSKNYTTAYSLVSYNWSYQFKFYNGTDVVKSDQINLTTGDTEWHRITVAINSTTMKTYLDTNLNSTKSISGAIGSNNEFLIFGALTKKSGFGNMTLDEVRIYNRMISQSEITSSNRLSIADKSGLVGWWRLNEGEGRLAHDETDYENKGVLRRA